MHRYKDSIYFMALKMVSNKEDAMDLAVETFYQSLLKKLDKYQPEYLFSTWLFRVATNNCIDFSYQFYSFYVCNRFYYTCVIRFIVDIVSKAFCNYVLVIFSVTIKLNCTPNI